MEEELTLEELYLLIDSMRERDHEAKKFAAALKGVDLDEGKADETFEAIKQRASAALSGKSEEEYVMEDLIGFTIESDDD